MVAGGSFGGGKVDPGCDARELARSFTSRQTVASCKVLLSTKAAKKAGVTMEDCLGSAPEPIPVVSTPVPVVSAPSVSITLPAPVVTVIQQPNPQPYPREVVTVRPPKPVVKKRLPPVCQNNMELRCVEKLPLEK
jgi:hypothetical protein